MKHLKALLLSIIFLLMTLPLFLSHIPLPPAAPLAGDLEAVPVPKLNFKGFQDGTYQSALEDRFAYKFPFRETFVRLENTLNLRAFQEVSAPRKSNPVILGKDNYLYEKSYINMYNGVSEIKGDIPHPAIESVEESARRLGIAAQIFKKKGINFLLVFYPHKAWIFPEYIQSKWLLKGGHDHAELKYTQLLNELKKNSVPFVDGASIFNDLKSHHPEVPLFVRGGTHWTYQGACHVLNAMIRTMQPQTNRRLPNLACLSGPETRELDHWDTDIASLLNSWDESKFISPMPKFKAKILGTQPRPAINLFSIRTSFSGDLLEILHDTGYTNSELTYWYFMHGQAHIDWNKDIFSKQWMIFEQSQSSYISSNTMDFLQELETQSSIYRAEFLKLNAQSLKTIN